MFAKQSAASARTENNAADCNMDWSTKRSERDGGGRKNFGLEFDAKHAWNPRERVIISYMETTLQRKVRRFLWKSENWRRTCCVQQ